MTVSQSAIIREMDADELKEYYAEQKAIYDKANDMPFDVRFEDTQLASKIQTAYQQITGKTITQ